MVQTPPTCCAFIKRAYLITITDTVLQFIFHITVDFRLYVQVTKGLPLMRKRKRSAFILIIHMRSLKRFPNTPLAVLYVTYSSHAKLYIGENDGREIKVLVWGCGVLFRRPSIRKQNEERMHHHILVCFIK